MQGWTMGWVRGAAILAAALASSAPPLSAQAPPDSARVEAARRLQPGSVVRFTAAGERGSGWVEEVGGDRLLLRLDGGGDPMRLDPARLDSLWVRTDAAGAGAAVGAVVGLVPVVATCGQELDECGLVPNGVLVVAASAALGWVVGRRIDSWRRLLP